MSACLDFLMIVAASAVVISLIGLLMSIDSKLEQIRKLLEKSGDMIKDEPDECPACDLE